MKVNKFVIFVLGISFLFSLFAIFLLSQCEFGSSYDCLLSKEVLFADFYYQYNSLKYTGVYGMFPSIEIPVDVDGGFDGVSFSNGETELVYHAPLYYYLASFLYVVSKFFNVNDLLALHIFSAVISLFVNILFYFFVKKISKYLPFKNKNCFVIYSLVLFMFLPTFLHVNVGVGPDVLFYLCIIAFFLVLMDFLEKRNVKSSLLLGIVIGIGLLVSLNFLVVLFTLLSYIIIFSFKKMFKIRNLSVFSFIIACLLGSFGFVRNLVLTGSIFGDLYDYTSFQSFSKVLFKFYRVGETFFAGIEGGSYFLKPFLVFTGIVLILLTLIGLLFYFKDVRKKINLNFVLSVGFFTFIVLGAYVCNPFIFLKEGICYGYGIQNRYLLPLAPIIPLFSSLALIKIQEKRAYLKYPIVIYITLTCLVFAIDFISALF